ncbi:Cytochrome c oxidase subunit 4 [Onygenales sp. PD_12]|nr:Cytochrome c oxidase subunit 4 [Emmonsiellopsis sp. PD_33]KAK2793239.1 Cytochrome c oxidase subunit 4 [Onygenales sp. PD_12]KAK2806842.1 Cytochrome c oxidase subunit 4 [Onygenales sp. PD_10]
MFVQRTAFALARRTPVKALARRSFTASAVRCDAAKPGKWDVKPDQPQGKLVTFDDIAEQSDLLAPGAKPGTIPTDFEQSTGLERLELLGKMQGIDIFDMRPLDASRKGTIENPIMVKSGGEEQYAGCTGYPADSHTVIWLTLSRDRPIERCSECGNVLKMEYVGPEADPHEHDHAHHDEHHHAYEEPKTMADFVKPDYWYK